ncbi:hypothetical protein DNK48_18450 [Streptomyces malaysiensis subsp. malaysiensis]|nr:hypothetical protein DNK48_18450 [Streptomyces malaysiensis]
MSATSNTSTAEPVRLSLPRRPPKLAPRCDVCAALAKQRQKARDRGTLSAATDADIELRNHPHGTKM